MLGNRVEGAVCVCVGGGAYILIDMCSKWSVFVFLQMYYWGIFSHLGRDFFEKGVGMGIYL